MTPSRHNQPRHRLRRQGQQKANAIGFADSDWAGEKDGAKSTSGYVFILNGGAVSWASKKQTVTAQSTTEAELISASAAAQVAVHLRQLLMELLIQQPPTAIFEDNNGCIKVANNPITSPRTKHIQVRLFYVRERVLRRKVELVGIDTSLSVADTFTRWTWCGDIAMSGGHQRCHVAKPVTSVEGECSECWGDVFHFGAAHVCQI
jgi:hypothetical protein